MNRTTRGSVIAFTTALLLALLAALHAAEFHVATNGNDANPGTQVAPFSTIQHAAGLAQAGDVITVHEGVYRERVNPPRGGESDGKRIVYQAAPGEKVVITGSEVVKGWEKVDGDTWNVTIPNKFFGRFNPYGDLIHGDWFDSHGRQHHTGCVYLNGNWFIEAAHFDDVLKPAGKTPLWFAKVDGASATEYLVNIAWFKAGKGANIPATQTSAKRGTQPAACAEGGQCVGFIRNGDWLRYEGVDFGAGADNIELHVASQTEASEIEIHLDNADGELLGTAKVAATGDWQKWVSVPAKIKPTAGKKNLCLVITPRRADSDNTTIWVQFPGVNPNEAKVEINIRQTVFTPEKTGINYITVRGLTLRNAATNWAPPSAGQFGVVSAYWNKGWIIENNEICYSKCCGVALGKYSDEFDNTNMAGAADPYTECVRRALKNGWNKETVGSHLVRNNHIHHCEQTGVVGSMGCAFSTVTGNVIHDIHVRNLFGGAEMAGIKFHGAIDVVISHNHIYRCGEVGGIWLDWMGQGAQVTGNLLHDNWSRDIFCEMQHGPLLIANNLLLSSQRSILIDSKGLAIVHNLITRSFEIFPYDGRNTPFHKAHSTELAGLHDAPGGDHRLYNNLFTGSVNLPAFNNAKLPCFAAGNVFTKGTQPSKFDADALVKPDFDPGMKLAEKSDGWYLTITEDKAWRAETKRPLVTTELLGKAKIPNLPYENPDGSPLAIDTDYAGKKRDTGNPFPGPFEVSQSGTQTIKVWPRSP